MLHSWKSADANDFTVTDILEGIYEGMELVADNLPDVIQMTTLAREAAFALGMNPNPVPKVVLQHSGGLYSYGGEDSLFAPQQCRSHLDPPSHKMVNEEIYARMCYRLKLVVHGQIAREIWPSC
jgi:hypothetical protein